MSSAKLKLNCCIVLFVSAIVPLASGRYTVWFPVRVSVPILDLAVLAWSCIYIKPESTVRSLSSVRVAFSTAWTASASVYCVGIVVLPSSAVPAVVPKPGKEVFNVLAATSVAISIPSTVPVIIKFPTIVLLPTVKLIAELADIPKASISAFVWSAVAPLSIPSNLVPSAATSLPSTVPSKVTLPSSLMLNTLPVALFLISKYWLLSSLSLSNITLILPSVEIRTSPSVGPAIPVAVIPKAFISACVWSAVAFASILLSLEWSA